MYRLPTLRKRLSCFRLACALLLLASFPLAAQPAVDPAAPDAAPALRGSIVEDRAARKLIEAGDARYDADELAKALEIWRSVIERYPRSRVRYVAHMKLGEYFLDRDRSYDRARTHFEGVADELNRDEEMRAEATLKIGICFYHSRNYGKCFQIMRDVIENFPVSGQVNQAYYYIGLGHFQLGHYSRAISALEKVGTTLSEDDEQAGKLEAGKRFFIKIEDADLAVLDPDESLTLNCRTSSGDEEQVRCFPVGRNVRLVLGSIVTRLGKPLSGNGTLEVIGGDTVTVEYIDQQTSDQEVNRKILYEVTVVGNGHVTITDGAFRESILGVVLGKTVNIKISDPDRDISDDADKITAVVEIHRLKTEEELEAEATEAAAAAIDEAATPTDPAADDPNRPTDDPLLEAKPEIERYKLIDTVTVNLTEVLRTIDAPDDTSPEPGPEPVDKEESTPQDIDPPGAPEPAEATPDSNSDGGQSTSQPVDDSIHSGIFQSVVAISNSPEVIIDDNILQGIPGDQVRVKYLDELHMADGVNELRALARCLEGNIGGVRVTRARISDQELRIQTQLKTADALTQIGNRYKEFGLKAKAQEKYEAALRVCETVMSEVQRLRGRLLEETYVQLWHVYFEMDRLNLAAAMCQRLQNEFPSSGFVDDALLQLADVAREQGELNRAISIYSRLVNMKTSQLRGQAQFGIAECYDVMADDAEGNGSLQLRDRAFQEYKKVFDHFPESGRVGDAVAKMADHYYEQKDYARAIDTFETVLENHPDAKFLDVILFNYGRCLFRMKRVPDAVRRFEQLIGEFPESPLATNAKQIVDAVKAQSP
jgi:tetratricopeptide (TPR) repeat protein